MAWPSDINTRIPQRYRSRGTFVADPRYAGGGWWSHPGLGLRLSVSQLEALWIKAGGPRWAAPMAAAIARLRESGGYSAAWNSAGATGLYQIIWPLHKGLGGARTRAQLLNPLTNTRAAVALFKAAGDKWGDWGGDAASLAGQVPGLHPSKRLPAGFGKTASGGPGKIGTDSLIHIGPSAGEIEKVVLTGVIVLAGAGLAVWGVANATGTTRRAASAARTAAAAAGAAA